MWRNACKVGYCFLTIAFALILTGQERGGNQRLGSNTIELQVQVLNDSNSGSRAKVSLSTDQSPEFIAYTDEFGNAYFHGVPIGSYILVVSIGGKELYRDQLSLNKTEGFRSEVVRIHSPADSSRAETVSVNDLAAPEKARKSYLSAVKAIRKHNWQEALQDLSRALMIYPQYAKAYNARGVVLAIVKQDQEAEAAFRNAIRFNPEVPEAHLNLGKFLLDTGRSSEAKDELQKAVDLDDANPPAVHLLVDCMIRIHDENSAVLLMRSLHRRQVQHAARLHLEIASELKNHGNLELAAEQSSLIQKDNVLHF
jgi:Tfp pilus assembly protein PilF